MASSMTRDIKSFWSQYDPGGYGTNMCPIHRVPEHIREVDRVAYEPIIISFGPYHHGGQHFQYMEKKKWEHLDRVLKLNCNRTLHDYIKAIAEVEKQARKCYSEQIIMERKKFVQMLLLDGCFILVNIDENVGTRISNSRTLNQGPTQTEVDGNVTGEELEQIYVEIIQETGTNTREEDANQRTSVQNSYGPGDWLSGPAWHDMLSLLENQIPFFVMERVYELVSEVLLRHYPIAIQENDRPKHFHHLLHLYHTYLRPSQKFDEELQYQGKTGYFHGLLRRWNVSGKSVDPDKNLEQMERLETGKLFKRWRRAEEYHEAGVQFMRREYDGQSRHSLLDIRFINGVMEIPCLPVDESSESVFKNLLALEQMDYRFGNDISAYVTFMSQIMDTPADATLLVEKGIIVHMLDSDEEVSALFTRLTKQLTIRFDLKYYLKPLCHKLEAHYQNRLNRWIAWLWHNHFVNPWLALAAFAAVVVLVCTIVQTIYTVLPFVKPA
ncbi:hypothetical protein TRIUR3_29468 [Triticum urartu]|uniref:Uncharacterized protein n=2 Tax=Triticum urartu TaxID=4572 RepID=M8A033_TRIUA|nr:hypothetical protein TRIUR3_29468 [Triticum urartu]